jgi:hypothetical protein
LLAVGIEGVERAVAASSEVAADFAAVATTGGGLAHRTVLG